MKTEENSSGSGNIYQNPGKWSTTLEASGSTPVFLSHQTDKGNDLTSFKTIDHYCITRQAAKDNCMTYFNDRGSLASDLVSIDKDSRLCQEYIDWVKQSSLKESRFRPFHNTAQQFFRQFCLDLDEEKKIQLIARIKVFMEELENLYRNNKMSDVWKLASIDCYPNLESHYDRGFMKELGSSLQMLTRHFNAEQVFEHAVAFMLFIEFFEIKNATYFITHLMTRDICPHDKLNLFLSWRVPTFH